MAYIEKNETAVMICEQSSGSSEAFPGPYETKYDLWDAIKGYEYTDAVRFVSLDEDTLIARDITDDLAWCCVDEYDDLSDVPGWVPWTVVREIKTERAA